MLPSKRYMERAHVALGLEFEPHLVIAVPLEYSLAGHQSGDSKERDATQYEPKSSDAESANVLKRDTGDRQGGRHRGWW